MFHVFTVTCQSGAPCKNLIACQQGRKCLRDMSASQPNPTPPAAPTLECPIAVWRFKDAPYDLRWLSTHGGDEDWLAEIPPRFAGEWIGWMESGSTFGCCDVSEHDHPTKPGWKVRIGAHS